MNIDQRLDADLRMAFVGLYAHTLNDGLVNIDDQYHVLRDSLKGDIKHLIEDVLEDVKPEELPYGKGYNLGHNDCVHEMEAKIEALHL